RNSNRPKHERAKPTITSIRPRVGACFCTPYRPLLLAAPAAAGGGVAGGVPVPAPAWPGHASRTGLTWLMTEPSAGLAWATAVSVVSAEHDTMKLPRRIGPWASCVLKINAPAWLVHAV